MKDHYEEVWRLLPEGGEPFDFARRREFLLARVSAGERVLDLGAGSGEFAVALAEAGARPIAVEIAESAVDRMRARHPGLDVRLAPIDGPLPLEDGSVDAVWAGEVIEHVADTAGWLSEVRRVLVPGGRLLLSTPYHGRVKNAAIALARFEAHADPLGEHLRFYTPRSLRSTLEAFAFEAIEVRVVGGPPLLWRTMLAAARRARLVATA